MIKTKQGRTQIRLRKGKAGELFADYACITLSVVDVLKDGGLSEEQAWKEIVM